MTYSHTSRRLATDAKIVLERAGYAVTRHDAAGDHYLIADLPGETLDRITIDGGTVDNNEVIRLCAARGCDGRGYPRKETA